MAMNFELILPNFAIFLKKCAMISLSILVFNERC